MRPGPFVGDGACLWQLTHQIGGQLLLGVGGIAQLLGGEDHLAQLLFRGNDDTLLVGGIHHHHLVLVGDQLLHGSVHLGQRHLTVELLRVLQREVDRHERLTGQEVIHTSVHVVRVTVVGLHLRTALGSVQAQFLGTVELRLGEPVLTSPLGHADGSDDTAQDVVALTTDTQGEGVFRPTEEEDRRPAGSALEGRVRLLPQFYVTVVEHGGDQTVHIVVAQVFLRVLLMVGCGLSLLVEVTEGNRLLLVLLDGHDHRVVITDGVVDTFCCLLRHGDG